ncbi:MAG: hypothetical protein GY861_10070 [bacterium]|nr:hypothetical protein [bacterium]
MNAPVFVKIDKYKKITQNLNSVRNKLEEAKRSLRKIEELKTNEDNELLTWKNELNKVEEKLVFVNSLMAKPENNM